MKSAHANPGDHWLHRIGVVTALAVFPLILVGAGVTSQDAGMAYPDWPTSGGHLINPPEWWEAVATRWEHGHRLLGWTVGLFAITLAGLSWRRGGAIRVVGLSTLVAIAVQGVLGGLRVQFISTPLAMVHGIWGQLCFCLAAATALMTSPQWELSHKAIVAPAAVFLRRLCLVTAGAVSVQLVLGAALRHFGGNHALLSHLAWAFVVTLLVGWTAMWVIAQHPHSAVLAGLGRTLAVCIALQLLLGGTAWIVTLGGSAVSPYVELAVPSAHVGVGALLLASSVLLALCLTRFVRPATMKPGAALPVPLG